jgi:hypothetical protein
VVFGDLLKRSLLGEVRYEGPTSGKVVEIFAFRILITFFPSFWGHHLRVYIYYIFSLLYI